MKELIKKILKEEVKRTINETTSIQPSDFCSPLEGVLEYSAGPVKSIFGNKRYKKNGDFSHRHAGIDWKANPGDTIRAPYGGEIEKTKIVSKCGGMIVVNHGSGVRTKYCHVRRFIVSEGETIVKGQQIGETGGEPGTNGAGNALGPHLHYSIHINTSSPKGLEFSNAVDPESGWVDDTDCDSKTSVNKNLKRCSKFSGSHIPRDVFIKTFELGYFIYVDGEVVTDRMALSGGIYKSDPGSPPGELIGMNATTFIEYAKISNITDNGEPITIDNVWVECELNKNIVDGIMKETLTRDEKIAELGN